MNRTEIEAMRREVLATLKYQEILELIGRSLHITSAESAPEEVLEQCRDFLPTSAQSYQPELTYREGAIAKYGILDLTITVFKAHVFQAWDVEYPPLGGVRFNGSVD